MTNSRNEKHLVAMLSVLSAVLLTLLKLVVGLLTGSLGILAEAAHSALDFLAAAMTWFAVRAADKPADSEHHYGHGKIENLSALFETLLLLFTCIWIVYEALSRIMSGHVDIDVTVWSFIVMCISIVVDVVRSRQLYAVAKKYNSQALEADALHFSTDIWSSSVVILGLCCVWIGDTYPQIAFLKQADAFAALAVALIVVFVSYRLGARSVFSLIDTAPSGLEKEIVELVEKIDEVKNCHNVRIRYSGAKLFIDLHVLMDGNLTLNRAHELTELIEHRISETHKEADVTVHPEPC